MDGCGPYGSCDDLVVTANDYRKYFFSLPSKMACDLTEWTWTQQFERDGPYKILFDLHIANFKNSGSHPNVIPNSKYELEMRAIRDIKKGEEILTDYGIYPTEWKKAGL